MGSPSEPGCAEQVASAEPVLRQFMVTRGNTRLPRRRWRDSGCWDQDRAFHIFRHHHVLAEGNSVLGIWVAQVPGGRQRCVGQHGISKISLTVKIGALLRLRWRVARHCWRPHSVGLSAADLVAVETGSLARARTRARLLIASVHEAEDARYAKEHQADADNHEHTHSGFGVLHVHWREP